MLIYHFMLEPGATDLCTGCSLFVDNIGHLAPLNARDTTMALVSRAPLAEVAASRSRMGWEIPWYSSHGTTFNDDFILPEGSSFGLTALLRDDDGEIYRTYGRQEEWENSPAGWPQTQPYTWWRLHDDYATPDRPEQSAAR